MSRYQFRKPTIGQQMDMIIAAGREDVPAIIQLLDAAAIDSILDLPLTELAVVANDCTAAVRTWNEEKELDSLPAGIIDFLAGLSEEEDE